MKNLEKTDIVDIAIEVSKSVYNIALNDKEAVRIIEKILDLVNSEYFSFEELENLLKIASKTKENIDKVAVMQLYIDRVIPTRKKVQDAKADDRKIYARVVAESMDKISRIMGDTIDLQDINVSSKILDKVVPTQEINFQVIFSEALEKIAEKMKNLRSKPNIGTGTGPEI